MEMNLDTDKNYAALLTRLTLGSVLLSHGLVKLLVFTVPGTIAFFASLGLPAVTAYLNLLAEIVCGSAILLGLYTRLAALLSIPVLLGAFWAHSGNGWLFTSEGGGWGYRCPVACHTKAG
jgi:putative oxidoreductase